MNFEITSENMRFSFTDLGGELISATSFGGFEYLWRGDERFWGKHAPILFPICGRLKNSTYTFGDKEYLMGCHGFLSESILYADKISENKISFSLSDNESTRLKFPFSFKFTVCYEAIANTLNIKTTVENTGNKILPFMLGAHPGFKLPLEDGLCSSDYFIDLGCESAFIHGLDDEKCFVSKTPTVYNIKDGLYKINEDELADMGTAIFSEVSNEIKFFSYIGKRAIKINYSNDFKYFCIWKYPSPEAEFICLEPWSGIPQDGIKDEVFETRASMIRLCPGKKREFNISITFI